MRALGGRLSSIGLPILTPRLALRLPRESDVPLFLRYLNDPRVSRTLSSRHTPYRREGEVAWVRQSRRAAFRGEKLNLVVTLRPEGTPVGGAGLEIRDWENGHGWTGYWLAPRYWHRGFASEAVSALCHIGFHKLKLHRVDAHVFEFNPRSMRLLRTLGFKNEGRVREVYRRGRRWYDEYAFGLLVEDFRPISSHG